MALQTKRGIVMRETVKQLMEPASKLRGTVKETMIGIKVSRMPVMQPSSAFNFSSEMVWISTFVVEFVGGNEDVLN